MDLLVTYLLLLASGGTLVVLFREILLRSPARSEAAGAWRSHEDARARTR
jgi:hypothetical protein